MNFKQNDERKNVVKMFKIQFYLLNQIVYFYSIRGLKINITRK